MPPFKSLTTRRHQHLQKSSLSSASSNPQVLKIHLVPCSSLRHPKIQTADPPSAPKTHSASYPLFHAVLTTQKAPPTPSILQQASPRRPTISAAIVISTGSCSSTVLQTLFFDAIVSSLALSCRGYTALCQRVDMFGNRRRRAASNPVRARCLMQPVVQGRESFALVEDQKDNHEHTKLAILYQKTPKKHANAPAYSLSMDPMPIPTRQPRLPRPF
jgi:hypothetical protein